MDAPSLELHTEKNPDTYPLLMERAADNRSGTEHVIDIRGGDAPSTSHTDIPSYVSDASQNVERTSSSRVAAAQVSVPSTNGVNTRTSSSSGRRGDARRRRSPLNSGLWISVELVLTMSQIIASVVVLSISKNEHPQAPLFVWIVGYASGCVATLPHLYCRYKNRNQGLEHDSAQTRPASPQVNAGSFPVPVTRANEGDGRHGASTSPRASQSSRLMSARLKVLMDYVKIGLDCFFAVWFVVGNVWIFGSHTSASDSPNMYRLCIVFLTFSCIGYAMPFILCATICCCLPCIISVLGFREDLSRTRGATAEAINALPSYKFKVKKTRKGSDWDGNSSAGDGGVVAAGTERERIISGEDAVCCICLAKYSNNEDLRELPCSHFFHRECVDKWLKINALCPLCKSEACAASETRAETN